MALRHAAPAWLHAGPGLRTAWLPTLHPQRDTSTHSHGCRATHVASPVRVTGATRVNLTALTRWLSTHTSSPLSALHVLPSMPSALSECGVTPDGCPHDLDMLDGLSLDEDGGTFLAACWLAQQGNCSSAHGLQHVPRLCTPSCVALCSYSLVFTMITLTYLIMSLPFRPVIHGIHLGAYNQVPRRGRILAQKTRVRTIHT
jgi:hypothetical protein